MKNYKSLIFIALILTLFFCVAAQSDCKSKNNARADKPNKNQNMKDTDKSDEIVARPESGKIKVIAEGANSNVEQPFIFVARSPETYAELQNLAENLPPASTINFDNSEVIAAFSGTKNTGGFLVEIKKAGNKIAFDIIAPPKDAMLSQALTSPYQVAVIPAENALSLDITGEWAKALENYKVTSGDFETSGGITGRAQKFSAEGTIGILRSGDFATLVFNLSGKDAEKARKLNAVTSGTIKDGKIELTRVDAGTFAQMPHPPLKISGTIANDKLDLAFESLPPTVSESFQVRGKIEASKVK